MEPYQQRVIDEKKELDEKIEKLKAFNRGTTFLSVEFKDQELLREQETVMLDYSDILDARIQRFNLT